MTGIDLSPKIVDRADERVCYNVLSVSNTGLVVFLTATVDPPPAFNSPCYADVKFKMVSVNVNKRGGRNGNGQYGGGGGVSKV